MIDVWWRSLSFGERLVEVAVFGAAMGFVVIAAVALVSDLRATRGDR